MFLKDFKSVLKKKKRGVTMFCVGQIVLYGTNGVCTVDDVTEKKIGKSKMEYYVLKPVCTNTSTLFVPISNQKLVDKIRCVLSEDEANGILSHLPEIGEWNDNKPERSENFRAVISSADSVELVRMIRLIHFHELQQIADGKRLHISDERFLKEAEKMVCEEFTIVLHTTREDILGRIFEESVKQTA